MTASARTGALLVALFVAVAALAPLFAPFDPAHIMLAATARGYFSGVATAPLLILAAAFLTACLKTDRIR